MYIGNATVPLHARLEALSAVAVSCREMIEILQPKQQQNKRRYLLPIQENVASEIMENISRRGSQRRQLEIINRVVARSPRRRRDPIGYPPTLVRPC